MKDHEGLVRRHDKYQFEVKLGYDLTPHHRRDRYRVETFFFLPENLDVNESTYSKGQFYRDLLLYIRFRTPDFSLAALLDPAEERSPLQRVPAKLAAFLESPSVRNARALDYELRLMGCVFKNALREQSREIEPLLEKPGGGADAREHLTRYRENARAVLVRYRALRDRFHTPGVPAGLRATFAFADEYMSLLVEGRTHDLLQRVQNLNAPAFAETETGLAALVIDEIQYRKSRGFPSIVAEDKDNETFVFRQSVLKKFITSALHLVVRTEEEGKGLEQMAMAIGAGIAMVFATTIAFYYQKVYGTLSLGFFAVLVVSYMFKDRLKAVVQHYLQRRLARHLFDQATNIHDPFNRIKIGVCREAVGFVPERRVDPHVLRLRDRDHITEIENTWRAEKVLHYVKEITLFSRRFWKNHSRKEGITDIVRFNLRNFLLKMDEPTTDLYFLKEGRSVLVRGTRVYHVNIVIKFVSDDFTRYERLRLVLNREGLKAVEPVGSDTVPGPSDQ
ncbi:MAG TPA: hypothetical protein PK362_02990 [Elusimicrobiota bacterium]|nr:hypothetical protein [Elusimicrobiota bacterium]HNC73839.1 hypothetical protein [Elusimicrobiota bacterium]HND63420.1 hypothetical protein [Elusimicrobiota bacterium]